MTVTSTPPVNAHVIYCPLASCHWAHLAEPVKATPETLAAVFGFGVMQVIEANERARAVEEALRDHLSSHPLEEWVREVTQLRSAAAVREQQIRDTLRAARQSDVVPASTVVDAIATALDIDLKGDGHE
jgi:hypothetical protein